MRRNVCFLCALVLLLLLTACHTPAQKDLPTPAVGTYQGEKITLSCDVITDLVCEADTNSAGFYNGYASVGYYGVVGEETDSTYRYNLIDYNGKHVFENGYRQISACDENGVALANNEDDILSAFYVNTKGEELGRVASKDEYFAFNKKIETAPLSEAQYAAPAPLTVAYAEDREGYMLYDNDGKTLSDEVFTRVGRFDNGIAPFIQNNKLGLVGADGVIIIPATFEVSNFPATLWICEDRIVLPYQDRIAIFKVTRE